MDTIDASSQFGRRLNQQEYEQKCRDLWDIELNDISSKERESAEFNLLIDYKLGVLFPIHKRVALLKARTRALRMILPNIIIGFLKPGSDPTSQVLRQMVKEMDKDLSRAQVAQMTDYSVEEIDKMLGPQRKRR